MVDENSHVEQNATTSTIESNESQMPKRRSSTLEVLENMNRKYPRLFYLFFYVLVPLWFLVGVSFLCGYMIAVIEMPHEVERNDIILRKRYNVTIDEEIARNQLKEFIKSTSDWCLDQYEKSQESSSILNVTDIKMFLDSCQRSDSPDILHEFREIASSTEASVGDLTFHWTRCYIPDENLNFNTANHATVADTFAEAYDQLQSQADSLEFIEEGLMKLSGHKDCQPNVAGAAWFWFTIMTTIGYGNAVPVTQIGRGLVYTLGFLSILLFTFVSRQAGYVSLAVADDWFRNHKLNFVTKGAGSTLFWLTMYYIWNAILVSIFQYVMEGRAMREFSFQDGYWFAYITTTTVGFGDIYFPHTLLLPQDLFYIPLCILVAFVLLANFLIKFAEWLSSHLSAQKIGLDFKNLHDVLEMRS